jgi:hypothetical protein
VSIEASRVGLRGHATQPTLQPDDLATLEGLIRYGFFEKWCGERYLNPSRYGFPFPIHLYVLDLKGKRRAVVALYGKVLHPAL